MRTVPGFIETILTVQFHLPEKGQKQHAPTVPACSVGSCYVGGWKALIHVVIRVERGANPPEVTFAIDDMSRSAKFANSQTDQHDYGDRRAQNEPSSVRRSARGFWGRRFGSWSRHARTFATVQSLSRCER